MPDFKPIDERLVKWKFLQDRNEIKRGPDKHPPPCPAPPKEIKTRRAERKTPTMICSVLWKEKMTAKTEYKPPRTEETISLPFPYRRCITPPVKERARRFITRFDKKRVSA